jgi:hypothetical protein
VRDLTTLPTAELEALRDNWMAAMAHLVKPAAGPAWGIAGTVIATSTTQSLIRRRVGEIDQVLQARNGGGTGA